MIPFALVALMAAGPAAPSETGWARVRSPRFVLLTDGGAAEALPAAAALSQFDRVLERLIPRRRADPGDPIVVLAFRDEAAFARFVPRHAGASREVDGFFQGGTARCYIAFNLRAERADRYDALYHEYAHLALNRFLPAQPAWVAEGLAEMYSAWRPAGGPGGTGESPQLKERARIHSARADDARVGLARPEHLGLLRARGLLGVGEVLRAAYTSEMYVREGLSQRFYAQSWLLAHYLVVGRPRGTERLLQYLEAITQGTDGAAAFRAAFGEDPESLAPRLRAYMEMAALPVASVALADGNAVAGLGPPPEVMPVAPAEIESLLADLLLHQDRPREARRHLERALATDPGFVPARDGLAQVALSQARWDEARAQLKAALDREPESPLALHRYADALVKEAARRGEVLSDVETDAAVSALEKAVGQAPHFADAAELLARLRPQPPRRRIALLEPVFTREPQRTDIGITLAGLYVRVNDLARAAAVLARAQASARDENMHFLAGHLRARIGVASSQTREVTGTLVRLECQAEGALDFVVEVADRRLVLRAPGPRAVLLYGPEGDPFERELICGPQRAPVSAFYLRRDGERDGLEGTLLSMTWSETSSD
jgi:tetratricopeptide (TPR) repeat protein